ncbi:MAG: hypothetical protein A2427_01050 [Candidatus Nealsonbacteria bacterium RIFOXYC1_FULL_40_7]|uniref:Class I SAM-dependent methyltransferase n=1 Tax=Candidatus Nealsonbacteria bacterium RIFOXYC1_FULL_40_7 TaxID=1801678 RepID=A0A1G2EMQ2_9BACT|nr:MAG: hypothetical protein A2427_01050 [Candidatus Nealsonbacteria bacterium RIFOXYC1_FULL_40_7]
MYANKYILKKYQIEGAGLPFVIRQNSTGIDFAKLLNKFNYKRGAEIGVERGSFSEMLCKNIPGLELTCIDSWAQIPDYRKRHNSLQDSFYRITKEKLKPYGCKIIKGFSTDVAKTIPDESLDFVYIDANHEFQHCTDDIAEWSKKVRHGGIVSGHDFHYFRAPEEVIHTKHVVLAWTQAYNVNPWFVFDKDKIWFWVK